MTTPTATNTGPALHERIASALTGIGEEAGSVIAMWAEHVGGGDKPDRSREYEPEMLTWAQSECEGRLGGALTHRERSALEACIRAHLEAGADPAHPSPAEMARSMFPNDTRAAVQRKAYSNGAMAERVRLRAILVAMLESGTTDRAHVLALAKGLR